MTYADGGLALRGLVAPLHASGQSTQGIPPVGRALVGSLVVIPISIQGTLRDPKINVVPAAAIGMTLFNLITARFLLPINLLDTSRGGTQSIP